MAELSWLGALGLALITAQAASAVPIHIGGIDAETQYNRPGAPASAGILTFDDADNGYDASQPGRVTTSDIAALIGADANLEVALDTSAFDPVTDSVSDAQFIGTGAMPEITLMSGSTVLLAFQVHLLDVQQALHSGSVLGRPDGKIALGNRNSTARDRLESHRCGRNAQPPGRRRGHASGDGAPDVEPEPEDDAGAPGRGLSEPELHQRGRDLAGEQHLEHHHRPRAEHGGAARLRAPGRRGRGSSRGAALRAPPLLPTASRLGVES
jgi:hypothetical protein